MTRRAPSLALLGATLGAAYFGACVVPQSFACDDDSQCGADGQCVAGGCAFPDDDCASGLRYGLLSALTGQCVELDPIAEGSGTETSASTSASTETSSATDTADTTESSGSEDPETSSETGETETTDTTDTTGEPDPAKVLAHYTFDVDDVVGLVVLDVSGNELHGLAEEVQPQPPGLEGNCFEFQAFNRVDIPLAVLDGYTEFTIELYIQLPPIAEVPVANMLYYGDASNAAAGPSFALFVSFSEEPLGAPRVYWSDGEDNLRIPALSNIGTGDWHHIAFTASLEGVQLYIDHELELDEPLVPEWGLPGLERMLIGAVPTIGGGFEGFIDELRFSDRPLSPDEMMPLP